MRRIQRKGWVIQSIRDVIAFPKTQKAMDLMMAAPSIVDGRQLKDVWLELALPKDSIGAASLSPGQVISFTVGLNDDDNGGVRDDHMIWSGTSTTSRSESFGTLVLRGGSVAAGDIIEVARLEPAGAPRA